MSKFKIFMLLIVIAEIVLILSANILYFHQNNDRDGRLYLVETRRLIKEIEERKPEPSEIEAMRFDQYQTIVGIQEFVAGEACEHDYLVEEIAGKLYRIEYAEERSPLLNCMRKRCRRICTTHRSEKTKRCRALRGM